MKIRSSLVTLALVSLLPFSVFAETAAPAPQQNAAKMTAQSSEKLTTEKQKLSYTIGVDLGSNLRKQGVDVDPQVLFKGLQDAMSDSPLMMNQETMETTLQNLQKQLFAKHASEFKQVAEKNKTEGAQFLSKNKTQPGVVTLANGLQYKVLTEGKGKKPQANDSVTVEYTGRLLNGEVFDSTEQKGTPVTFRLNEVIPGWTQALQLMPEGSTWEVYVPSDLAYGARGVGGPIGPNQTLVFKIHLISSQAAKATGNSKS
ncbi:MAG: FKBP-type peptidyl-prolyl cis-trans isomerase [Proteobacteria bacterium]|nr:FKBP-type peptidyl-prolyl cis-trans isomerase [Pseudomonadota bacterium]